MLPITSSRYDGVDASSTRFTMSTRVIVLFTSLLWSFRHSHLRTVTPLPSNRSNDHRRSVISAFTLDFAHKRCSHYLGNSNAVFVRFSVHLHTYVPHTTRLPRPDRHTPTAGYYSRIREPHPQTHPIALSMSLLAPTKGQKKAAKRAAKKRGASATKENPSSSVEYALVGTIKPEQLDTPAIPFTPTQDSAISTRDVAVFTPQHFSLMSSEAIVAAPFISIASQQLSSSSTDILGSQSSGPSPMLSALPLESLGSFNRDFTFSSPTGVTEFCECSTIANFSNYEGVCSSPEDTKNIEDRNPTSLAFSEVFVNELSSPVVMIAAVPGEAFKETLSRTSDTTESSIFTRLKAASTDNAPAPVYISKYPFTAADVKKELEVCPGYASHVWTLVPYCEPTPISRAQEHDVYETGTGLLLGSILRSRMFLASADGVTQCIAHDKLLHDVEIIKDDGGSDFDSVTFPSRMCPDDWKNACHETSKFIGCCIEDTQVGSAIRDRFWNAKDSAELEDIEVPGRCLHPSQKCSSDREVLSSYSDSSGFGSDDAVSVSAEKCEVVATHPTSLQTTARSGSKDEVHEASHNEASTEELAKTVSTSSHGPDDSDCASELSRMRLGTESLFSCLEVMEARDSGKATRHAVVAAFLQLVNIERKKRGARTLPSACTAHSVLSSGILLHAIMLGTTTVASLVAQLCFDEKDEVEMGDVYTAWDRLGREEVQQQRIASGGSMGVLGRVRAGPHGTTSFSGGCLTNESGWMRRYRASRHIISRDTLGHLKVHVDFSLCR